MDAPVRPASASHGGASSSAATPETLAAQRRVPLRSHQWPTRSPSLSRCRPRLRQRPSSLHSPRRCCSWLGSRWNRWGLVVYAHALTVMPSCPFRKGGCCAMTTQAGSTGPGWTPRSASGSTRRGTMIQSRCGCRAYRALCRSSGPPARGAALTGAHNGGPGAAAPATPVVHRNQPLCTGARPQMAVREGPGWEPLYPISVLAVLTFLGKWLAFQGAGGVLHFRRACGRIWSTRRYWLLLLGRPLRIGWLIQEPAVSILCAGNGA